MRRTAKTKDGKCNVVSSTVRVERMNRNWSQELLSKKLEEVGVILPKRSIHSIESGKRVVTDLELIGFMKVFEMPIEDLINWDLLK